eukprot:CAMPEP_0194479114 /NCGR_PEP_ID=MMETSP0253-20130528/2337_1 /TAXON_ID=2966 /ORGANISM="Noctiluca scintillans" /LENGTH=148 /DNA_ID=CAMNT_0039318289 /DNA_START=57 /DNA_END=503 /DNA_ORIENTATION=-
MQFVCALAWTLALAVTPTASLALHRVASAKAGDCPAGLRSTDGKICCSKSCSMCSDATATNETVASCVPKLIRERSCSAGYPRHECYPTCSDEHTAPCLVASGEMYQEIKGTRTFAEDCDSILDEYHTKMREASSPESGETLDAPTAA